MIFIQYFLETTSGIPIWSFVNSSILICGKFHILFSLYILISRYVVISIYETKAFVVFTGQVVPIRCFPLTLRIYRELPESHYIK